jgi:hypothetical protein
VLENCPKRGEGVGWASFPAGWQSFGQGISYIYPALVGVNFRQNGDVIVFGGWVQCFAATRYNFILPLGSPRKDANLLSGAECSFSRNSVCSGVIEGRRQHDRNRTDATHRRATSCPHSWADAMGVNSPRQALFSACRRRSLAALYRPHRW